jgi:pimeloyl-ACP methyl ester carboxylesterase
MKIILIMLFPVIANFTINAQDITGQWSGVLKVQGVQLRLVFNISKTENGYSSTMDSPDQGAKGIPVTSTRFENSKLRLEITNAKIEYSGELKENEIIGTFRQNGQEFPVNLLRGTIGKEIMKRPQEPVKPYNYYTEEIIFKNLKANIALSGTLSLPKTGDDFPVVILISGSGPQDRDEALFGHKPFLVISDYFTNHGIAVLRYDDRGVGQSEGDFKMATSANFATDVESAIAYLKTRKEINKNKIGLVGHSEGGLIAPIVASQSKDVSFIVLLAGTGLRGDKVLLFQQELIAKASGISALEMDKSKQINAKLFEMVIKSDDNQKLKTALTDLINQALTNDSSARLPKGMKQEAFVSMQVSQILSPWMQYFLKYDPSMALERVKCPVLAINGEKDLQVSPKENLTAIKNALAKGGNKRVTTIEFPGLNHLFQECTSGLPGEYAEIEQTFSPEVLDQMTNWIITQTREMKN